MKIGIFGGVFNPPHIGHINAAKTAASAQGVDALLIIPTGTPPHKLMPAGTPTPELRLQMAKNSFDGLFPNTIVSEMEVFSHESNYTIDTIKIIQRRFPGAELLLFVGNDMYDTLDTWKDSKELLTLVTPVLLPRDVISISSTEIREMLRKREGVDYISKANYALIIQHRLYGARPNWDWLRSQAHAMLDPGRIPHADGCEKVAMKLAMRWGEDIDEAREAAILHDITKKLDFDENMCIITGNGLETKSYNINEAKLLHSVTASILAKTTYGVSDRVAKAIRLHTTGDAGMSLLDKIVYIADYIEETRVFDGVEQLRQEAFTDIDKAMVTGLEMTISDLAGRGIAVNKATIDAINELK